VINSYEEGGVLSDAIRAISRGDPTVRSLNAKMGKTYYDRFIKPSEKTRLKHFMT